jgi:hypothetical protein
MFCGASQTAPTESPLPVYHNNLELTVLFGFDHGASASSTAWNRTLIDADRAADFRCSSLPAAKISVGSLMPQSASISVLFFIGHCPDFD